jgi:tetratricopeptide (TPR) repeat protein
MYLVEIAHTQYNSAQLQEAQDTLAQARQCLFAAQVQQGTVWGALEYIGAYVQWKQGTYEQASVSAHKALACFEAALAEPRTVILVGSPSHLRRTLAGDPVDIGRVHRFLGALLSSSVSSSVQQALEHQQQARAIFEQHGYLREASSILCDIGNVYLQQAEHASADTYFQQCLQVTERIGDTGIQCMAWCNRGIVAQREGRSGEARTYSERALALAQAAQDPVYEIMVRSLLATLLVDSTHLDEARAQLTVICTLARHLRNRPCTGMAFVTLASYHLGQVEQQQGDAAHARSSTHRLTRVACELAYALTMHLDTDFYLEALLLSARVQWLLGNTRAKEDARQLVQQSAQIGALWMQKRGERLLAEMGKRRGR